MTTVAGYTQSGSAASGYTFDKTTTGWTAGPYSDAMAGDFVAAYDLTAAQSGFFGVDETNNPDGNNYSLSFEFDGGLNSSHVRVNAANITAGVVGAASHFFWMRRVGSTVTALRHTANDISAATVLHTITNASPLRVNIIIHGLGSAATCRVEAS